MLTRRKSSCVYVYCNSNDHFSANCMKVLSVESRKSILRQNKMCYNCTGTGHTAPECKSRGCKKCQRKHHTFLCEEKEATVDAALHGTVLANVETQTFRVMLDAGA